MSPLFIMIHAGTSRELIHTGEKMKTTSGAERKRYAFDSAPRCGARTKHNNGLPCRLAAIRGKKRCRVHGGGKGSGAQLGNTNAMSHGMTTRKIKEFREEVREIIKDSNRLKAELG